MFVRLLCYLGLIVLLGCWVWLLVMLLFVDLCLLWLLWCFGGGLWWRVCLVAGVVGCLLGVGCCGVR